MRKIRISLRHTGVPELRFGVSRGYFNKLHCNIFFGRFFLAIREKLPNEVPRQFIELDMGRAQLKYRRLWASMSEDEKYLYLNHNPEHLRLEYFFKTIKE